MIRKVLKEKLSQVLKEEGYPGQESEVQATTDETFGDYFTNIAIRISKLENSTSLAPTAKKFEAKLAKVCRDFEVKAAENGLINFTLKTQLIQKNIQKIIKEKDQFGSSDQGKGRKARVEFVSANPTGPLHIGNARGGPLGDTLASILEFSGYKVLREYLHNNIGSQVEKVGETLLNLKHGAKLEEQEYKGAYLIELVKEMPEQISEPKEAGNWATEVLLKDILNDCKKIGINYNKVYKESDFEKGDTKKVLQKLKSKGILKEKEGAIWFAADQNYLKDKEAVVLKSNGQPTYFANDIAYHNLKFSEKYDQVIDELGSGHDGHIPKLKAAISALGFNVADFKVIVHQNVRVKRGEELVKMSKRAGNFVTAREVLDEVGKDAFRFFMLFHDHNTHMDFDLELAKKKTNENPVYYIQYGYARCSSILERAEKEGTQVQKISAESAKMLKEAWDLKLAKKLVKFPEVVEDISGNFSVHQLARYVYEVADLFHKYYEQVKVISNDQGQTKARLQLVIATRIVLGNALKLMGISAPERM
jgi:arginyl-tRNA synthetase